MIMEELAERYHQLYLTPAEGVSVSQLYTEIVNQGKKPEALLQLMDYGLRGFLGSNHDKFFMEDTPAGVVEIVYIYERADFERFVQIMMYRGELVPVPKSMGAVFLSGIINWRKIDLHKEEYFHQGGLLWGWKEEFKRFTSDKNNYKDNIIVVSHGGYSGINALEVNLSESEWNDKSLTIRVYHECAHFISRKLYPKKVNALWDELLADCIGLLFAFHRYDASLAKQFLGVSEDGYLEGRRIKNYFAESASLDEEAMRADILINRIAELVLQYQEDHLTYYDILCKLVERGEEFVEGNIGE